MSMIQLVDKYQPRKVADFIGLAAPKALLSKLIADPYSSAWLLMGGPGTGKSTIAMTAAEQIRDQHGCAIHHMKSADCTVDAIEKLVYDCQMTPMQGGRWHVAIVEEAGSMGPAAQKAWLSVLDTTGMPSDAIFLFTANPYVIGANGRITPHALKDRFLDRVRTLNFTEPSPEDMAAFLERIWLEETKAPTSTITRKGKSPSRSQPDFKAIAESSRNIRSALMQLETELLVPGSFVPAPIAKSPIILAPKMPPESSNHHAQPTENEELRQRRSEAAKRAWQNSPKLQAMRKRA